MEQTSPKSVNNEKIVIWEGSDLMDIATVRTCLELNGVPVISINDSGVYHRSIHRPKLMVYKNDHGPAVKILYENGYITAEQFRTAMGLNVNPARDKERQQAMSKAQKVAMAVLVIALIVALISLFT